MTEVIIGNETDIYCIWYADTYELDILPGEVVVAVCKHDIPHRLDLRPGIVALTIDGSPEEWPIILFLVDEEEADYLECLDEDQSGEVVDLVVTQVRSKDTGCGRLH